MERVFSVEEIPNPYWAPPHPQSSAAGAVAAPGGGGGAGDAAGAMNRCPSEWYFQKFLEQAVLDSPGPVAGVGRGSGGAGVEAAESKPLGASAPAAASSSVVDPVEYNAMLKQKLEKDLAAVAMWRASGAAPPEHSAAVSSLPSVDVPHAAPLKPIGGTGSLVQNKLAGAPGGGSGPHVVQNADIPIKQTTSSSSREQSDDDDMEGDAETTGNANPVQQRLQRRKQSNRESARRSRSRKAAHLNELETQVAQLRVENSSLLRRLADVNQKFNEAAVDNRVLKADVETLRAKVKMAEDSVKRVTGMNALFPAVSDMSSLSMPFNGSPTDSTSDAAAPIQDDPNSYFANPSEIGGNNGYMPDIASSAQEDDNFVNGSAGKMGRTASLQRVASLDAVHPSPSPLPPCSPHICIWISRTSIGLPPGTGRWILQQQRFRASPLPPAHSGRRCRRGSSVRTAAPRGVDGLSCAHGQPRRRCGPICTGLSPTRRMAEGIGRARRMWASASSAPRRRGRHLLLGLASPLLPCSRWPPPPSPTTRIWWG